jgi:23S rRNA (cytidine2498-2'-O)-methyltransferase
MEKLESIRGLVEPLWASFAVPERKKEFEAELHWRKLIPIYQDGDLYVFRGKFQPICWARVNWNAVQILSFSSIGNAGNQLKKIAPEWIFLSNGYHRRGSLIAEKFRSRKPLTFPLEKNPYAKTGGFCLLSEDVLLCSVAVDRMHPTGNLDFVEDKAAPSRAYLKLWEALTEIRELPAEGERCLELGASPGGWTYVLLKFGSEVLAYDRSPLDPAIQNHPQLKFHSGDAFQATPKSVGQVQWLLSDLICYPERLAEFLKAWLAERPKMICTLKFQGEFDPKVLSFFCDHGKVLHLNANKNELTWFANCAQIGKSETTA